MKSENGFTKKSESWCWCDGIMQALLTKVLSPDGSMWCNITAI